VRVPPRPALLSRLARGLCFGVLWMNGCGVFRAAAPSGSPGGSAYRNGSPVERREVDDHPPINLVVRLGDPEPAIAFASAHDLGSVASTALSALILSRLHAHGIDGVVSAPTNEGIELAVLAADARAARAFIEQVTRALATPIAEKDEALPQIQQHLAALRSRGFAGRAEATVATCSGELGQLVGAPQPDVRTPAGRAELEKYRRAAFAARSSAFAALGPNEFVNAAAEALERVAAWPEGDPAEDPWPAADVVDTDAVDGRRHLSVALRVANAEAALSAVRTLSASDAALSSRLRTFLPGYQVQTVAFRARPRGACLRVDLALPDGDPGPSLSEATQATRLVTEEMRAAQAVEAPILDDSIVLPSDPRKAAARAAWRALTGRKDAGSERRFVALSLHPAERPGFERFASALSEFERRPVRAPLETRLGSEPGQGELWLLLGSPCGTLGESNDDAGQSALALTLAARAASSEVALEPWLTPDAMGLLAHAPRNPHETPSEQAERVASALSRAISEPSRAGDALALAQGQLFAAVGGSPRPGYARLLDALAPDHLAWLEPRGTWASLAQANRDSLVARTRDLLRGPLRVAVLANHDDAQAAAAAHTIERWFAPFRDDPRRCQTTPERGARSGELSVSVPESSNAESAYLGLPFPSRLKFDREAEAVASFLSSPAGPLARALGAEHLNAAARVSAIGGGRAAALVVEIHATDDDERRATLEVRRALDRWLASEPSNDELATLQRSAAERALSESLDPRRRIVDLWRGAPPWPPLSRSSVRAFQALLSTAPQVVVYVAHRD